MTSPFLSLKVKVIFYFYFKIHYNNTKVKCFKLKKYK